MRTEEDQHKHPKIKQSAKDALRDIEVEYNIELEYSEDQHILFKNSYKTDSDGNVIELDLRGNQIVKIPSFKGLETLVILDLSLNRIRKIENLEALTALTMLNLWANQISKIENLEALTALTQLYLSNNQISKIENLETLTALTQLDLSYNQISKIENLEALKALTKLTRLTIHSNDFEKDLPNIKLEQDFRANHLEDIRIYFKLLDAEDFEEVKKIKKVMLVGNHASGKSTFLDYFFNGTIPKKAKESTHILSIEPYPKQDSNKSGEVEAIFYDFGGQDYYHGIYKAFMTNHTVNLIFWKKPNDKNALGEDSQSSEGTQNFNRAYWIKQVRHYGEKNESWLIQTHRDTDKREALADASLQHAIEDEYHIALTNPIKANLKTLRENLLETIQDTESYKSSKSYVEFVNELLGAGAEAVAIDTLEVKFQEVKERSKIDFDVQWVLRQLAREGRVLYYPDNPILKDKVWLNPQAIVEKIHSDILSRAHIEQYRGQVPKKEFEEFADDESIRELLVENKVIYLDKSNKDNNKYIIPGYLPLVKSETEDFFYFTPFGKPQLTVKFEYFIPFGLINQLICHYGQTPELKKYWRDLLLFTLDDKQTQIEIKLNFKALQIEIYVSSSTANTANTDNTIKRKVSDTVKDIFDDIMAFYYDEPTYLSDLVCNNRQQETEATKIRVTIYSPKDKYPDDMYISIDNKQFVHYNTLNDPKQTQDSIVSYRLDENFHILKDKQLSKLSTRAFRYLVPQNREVNKMRKIFISYSKKNVEYKERLVEHLKLLKIFDIADSWDDSRLAENGGKEWHDTIQKELQESDMIVYMLSVDFFNSSYILNHEVSNIMNEHHDKKVLCVLVCDYANIYALTKDAAQDQDKSNATLGVIKLNQYQVAPYDYDIHTHTDEKQKALKPLCRWEPNTRDSAYAQIVGTIETMLGVK
jgi:internalin A